MKILFLCGLYPPAYKDQMFSDSKRSYQFAAQNFQEALIGGFIENNINLHIVTLPFLSTYPFGYKKIFLNFKRSDIDDIVSVAPIKILNLPIFSSMFNNAKKEVLKWCKINRTEEELHIIVYSLNADLMKVAIEAKEKYPNLKLSLIILDLPEYMGANRFHKILGIYKKNIEYIYLNLKSFDQYVLLTEAMVEKLCIQKNKYVVIEGIYKSKHVIDTSEISYKDNKEMILYSGALNVKYGLQNLLDAFHQIASPDVRLVICGDGEAKELVTSYCRLDERIIFKGKVPHEEVLALQKEASLLINPRQPEGEYTKYSFPSKTMEYFASGTPVLMYRLPGIPEVYFNYCYVLDDYSVEGLRQRIEEILKKNVRERMELGSSASKFILNYKSAKVQVQKILELLLD
ncbi:hypothetical protein AAW12_11585 [Sphingobacterium sp. Ag1]|uniref:glycosyltransferase n=1 Tax=Sphingobacterium sp. Ag1 TaxID=1643451 RepID=UPI000627F14F|nr:glycosyltransferase [Sphingobacterium sp. Ag1]KKO91165.1 hypothetical protein AAW12_11585 [Sphingobacterium sp. Ag1]